MNHALRFSQLFVLLACIALFVTLPAVYAGKYNSGINIGDQPAAWKELPGTDGRMHSLKDVEKDIVVVVFTCNSCPYAIDYEQRINELAQRYASADSKVAVVAINVNKIEGDLLPAMKKRAEEKKFAFAYLFDETQQVAKDFGAVRTPEFFVLNKERRIVYMGAMDDNTKADQVKVNYLEKAIAATLASQTIETSETPPVGCAIRFTRERRKP